MKGSNVVAYTARFCELVVLCPNMIPTEGKKIERYIWGLVPPYQGNVLASHPTTFDSAKRLAQWLIDHGVRTPAATTTLAISEPTRTADSKRKFWDDKKKTKAAKKRQVVALHAAITLTAAAPIKQYAGSLPKCNKCNFHHAGTYREMQCLNCNGKGTQPVSVKLRRSQSTKSPVLEWAKLATDVAR